MKKKIEKKPQQQMQQQQYVQSVTVLPQHQKQIFLRRNLPAFTFQLHENVKNSDTQYLMEDAHNYFEK